MLYYSPFVVFQKVSIQNIKEHFLSVIYEKKTCCADKYSKKMDFFYYHIVLAGMYRWEITFEYYIIYKKKPNGNPLLTLKKDSPYYLHYSWVDRRPNQLILQIWD